MELGILLRLVGVMNLIIIFSSAFSIQGRELYLRDFTEKKHLLYSDIYRPISFRLGMMMGTTKFLHFDISLDDLDHHSSSQLYEKSKTLVSICPEVSLSILMKFSLLP